MEKNEGGGGAAMELSPWSASFYAEGKIAPCVCAVQYREEKTKEKAKEKKEIMGKQHNNT